MRIAHAWGTPNGPEVFRSQYDLAEKISIDFAVMQEAGKAGKVLVIHAPYQWDDVGSWLALERRNPQDQHGNTIQALHCGVQTTRCVVVSDGDHLIGTIGVSDLIIIQNGNATLVATRENEGEVKKLVDEIKARGLGRFL
jgi:mannose-1-phosphate guanylyltransferase